MNGQVLPKLPMAEYLRLPAVSASILKTGLERCWRAAWFDSWLNPNPPPPDDTAATDAGTIAHAILLEGSEKGVAVIDPYDHPADKTGAIPEGWTNKSIREARDTARAAGLIPILEPKMIEIRQMVTAARAFIDTLKSTEPAIWAAFQPGGGESEVTMLWDEGATRFRIRPDRISRDRNIIIDAKFTDGNAEPDFWGRAHLVKDGHYINAGFYRRGIERIFGGVVCEYVYLVVEMKPPFLPSLVGIEPQGYDLGAAKISTAIAEWQQCERTGIFPGYPNRVCYPQIPAYVETAWQQREVQSYPFADRLDLGSQG